MYFVFFNQLCRMFLEKIFREPDKSILWICAKFDAKLQINETFLPNGNDLFLFRSSNLANNIERKQKGFKKNISQSPIQVQIRENQPPKGIRNPRSYQIK